MRGQMIFFQQRSQIRIGFWYLIERFQGHENVRYGVNMFVRYSTYIKFRFLVLQMLHLRIAILSH